MVVLNLKIKNKIHNQLGKEMDKNHISSATRAINSQKTGF